MMGLEKCWRISCRVLRIKSDIPRLSKVDDPFAD